MAENNSKSAYGVLMAILFLLLPGSWALQLKMGGDKSQAASASSEKETASDKKERGTKDGDKEGDDNKGRDKKGAACPKERSKPLETLVEYCTAVLPEKSAALDGPPASGQSPAPESKPPGSKPPESKPVGAASCRLLSDWGQAGTFCSPRHVQASIALLPERGWGLDGALESIIRAYERAGFTLVRWDLPSPDDERKRGEARLGSLLFDNPEADSPSPGADPSSHRTVELVYLVPESPTDGVDTATAKQALKEVLQLWSESEGRPLRILGPTFSGSAQRLGWLLGDGLQGAGLARLPAVRVVSGTATSRSLLESVRNGVAAAQAVPLPSEAHLGTLGPSTEGLGPGCQTLTEHPTSLGHRRDAARPPPPPLPFEVTVESMVRSDPEMIQGLWRYLTCDLHAVAEHIAIVSESSTVYGQGTQYQASTTPASATKQPKAGCEGKEPLAPFTGSMWLPMPSGLSHLRAEWARQGHGGGASGNKSTAPRRLDQVQSEGSRRTALPLYERGTLNLRDLSLAALLTSICQEGIRYVGLFLTDQGDKEFLAQRISLQCPNVRLFTLESELDYLLTKNYQYMRGTLIASTYPLYSRNTQWSSYRIRREIAGGDPVAENGNQEAPSTAALRRLQFARQADQGLYNATLRSLERTDLMQEYGPPRFVHQPDDNGWVRPPVWISAVGRDGLLPLRAYEELAGASDAPDGARGQLVPAAVNPPAVAGHWQQPTYTPYDLGAVRLVLLLISILAFMHSYVFFRNQYNRPTWISRPHERARFFDFMAPFARGSDSTQPRPSHYYLFLFASLWLALTFLTLVLALRFRSNNMSHSGPYGLPNRAFLEDLGYSLTGVVAMTALGLALADVALRWILPARALQLWRAFATRTAASLSITGLALAVPSGLVALGILSFNNFVARDPKWVLFLRRSSQTDYELSLLVPTVFLALVGYLWGLSNLRRLTYTERRRPITPAGMHAPGQEPARPRPPAGLLSPKGWLWIMAGTTVAMLPLLRRLSTIDHWLLDVACAISLWAVAVAVIGSLIRVGLAWHALRRQLFWAAHHPIGTTLKALPATLLEPLRSLLTAPLSAYTEQALIAKQSQLVQESYAAVPESERQALGVLWPTAAEPPWRRLQEPTVATLAPVAAAGSPRSGALPVPPSLSPDQELARLLVDAGLWSPTKAPTLAFGEGGEPEKRTSPGGVEGFYQRVQELLALRLVIYLFHTVTPLREAMLFVSASLILTLLSLNSYPFQPAQSLETFTWLLLLACMALLGLVLLQMKRDAVLSRLAAGDAGKFDWNTGLGKQFSLVILAPLLTMLATKVPALSWLLGLLQQQTGN